MAVILITHDLGLAASFCDDIHVMYAGRFVERGPVEPLFARPGASVHGGAPERRSAGSTRTWRRRSRRSPGSRRCPQQLPAGCPFHPRCPSGRRALQHGGARLRRRSPTAARRSATSPRRRRAAIG